MFEDYYSILGITKGASELQIRKAYRRLVLKYHPDRNPGDKLAEEQFKKVVEAYGTLSNAAERAEYDRLRAEFTEAATGSPPGGAGWGRAAAFRAEASAQRRARERRETAEAARRFRERRRQYAREAEKLSAYRIESNELEQRDVLPGIVAGAIVSALCAELLAVRGGTMPEVGRAALLCALAPLAGGPAGYLIGRASRLALDGVINLMSDLVLGIDKLADALPTLLALTGACAALTLGAFSGAQVPSWHVAPGALAAGLASLIGSAFGRAFTAVARRAPAKILGVGIGAAVAGVIGVLCGSFFAIFTAAAGGGFDFFNELLTSAVGGIAGGALGAALGSIRTSADPRHTSCSP